jgi:parallel beta-helix repeat protein
MARLVSKENAWAMLLALMFLGLLGAAPLSAQPFTYYVANSGNDANNCVAARSSSTPLQTIGKAISACIVNGDTVIVKPGFYPEAVDLRRENVTLRAEPRRGATIQPPPGVQGVLVDSLVGVTVEGFIVQGGSTGISFIRSDNGTVRDNVVYGNTVHGINFSDSAEGTIEKNIVHTNAQMGIRYKNGANGVVRNNLVYNNLDWGISLEMDPASFSTANVIESNTVDRNGDGIRLLDGGGSITHNIITGTQGTGLKSPNPTQVQEDYNNSWGNIVDFENAQTAGPHTISVDPRYVDPDGADGLLGGTDWEDDSYHLSQLAAGQQVNSPCLDRGAGPAAGSQTDGSTATDNFPDEGIVDLGFHYAIFRSTLQVFSISSVSTAIAKSGGVLKTTYTISGQFTLGAGSNGINPVAERTRVEVDTYSETLPLGSCGRPSAGTYNCGAPSPGITSLKIKFTSSTSGTFDLIVKLVPTPSNPLPPNVRLRLFIGDDIGVAEKLYVRGNLFAP